MIPSSDLKNCRPKPSNSASCPITRPLSAPPTKNYSRPAHAAFIKDVDDRGRVFYPNLESRKARHQREVYTRQLVVG